MEWISGFFDISIDRANQFYTWGWRASVVGAIITMCGVGLLWMGTRVRDHDSELQMANLGSEAGRARESAGKLEVRAAELEKEAADARAETERLKARVAWRELSTQQANDFVRALNGQSIGVAWSADDPERDEYAGMFIDALKGSGLYGGEVRTGINGLPPIPGLSVASRTTQAGQTVISALKAAGLDAKLVPPTPYSGDVTLIVGPRPRPKL
jgi:hypothetical protein